MNKIFVSILFAVILVLGINKITDVIFYVEKPEKSAYQITNVATTDSTTTAEISSGESESENIMALFASTSAADGAKIFKKNCSQCHSVTKEGKNKIGPKLFAVLGRQAGSISDYKYSKAMAAHGKKWTVEEMNNFLIKPKAWIKGTKMSYIGLRTLKDRAAIILYLNENTDSPLPLQ